MHTKAASKDLCCPRIKANSASLSCSSVLSHQNIGMSCRCPVLLYTHYSSTICFRMSKVPNIWVWIDACYWVLSSAEGTTYLRLGFYMTSFRRVYCSISQRRTRTLRTQLKDSLRLVFTLLLSFTFCKAMRPSFWKGYQKSALHATETS